MASIPKKPSTPSNSRRPAATTSSSASPARLSTSTGSSTATTVNRSRSVRSGAPVSARAAARTPEPTDAAVSEVKAEMQAQLDDMRDKLDEAEKARDEYQKQNTVLQAKLDESLKEQTNLEESVHEHTERIEELENEKRDNLRARRELEQIYESERATAMKEKEEAQTREEDLQNAMQRLKESLAQREMRAGLEDDRRPSMSRSASNRSGAHSPNLENTNQFAPPSSIQRSDSRSSSKLVMAKDKIIESLRMELAEAQIKLVEVENMGGGHLQELQKQIYETKIQNARLMEENESFQLLLSEKTLNGDLAQSDLLRIPSNSGSRPSTAEQHHGTSLADELASQSDGEGGETERRLQVEVNNLKDQNKALTLYINNIISRLLQHEQFEQILDKSPDVLAGPGALSRRFAGQNTDKELPPPPPPAFRDEGDDQSSGLLQRAKSVIGGKKSRPMSFVPSADRPSSNKMDEPGLTENIKTAPSIPLARASPQRNPAAHRRTHSEWPAASVVTSMYRGPTPGLQGPVSPGLTSPTKRNPFFTAPQPLNVGGSNGQRVPSAPAATQIAPASDSDSSKKENADPRDSKEIKAASHRSSVTSNPSQGLDVESHQESGVSDMSNPSTPPRSTASSGERDGRAGGAIMMGSKMRPLRLVQGADDQDKKAANRGSWFGWMNKGGVAPPTSGLGGKPEGSGA
ncbi:Hypothetical protein R9X50_00331700 [Acrodontium crateriforme]|uniref:M serotype protein n=1 Tax=Acrodontium crateriforme TaxID=150365 RepID=A0AAQ3M5I2_9PEZI|nr:Hypothetical protein R9X50_00331700 [Acrodontium crateriforme]